MNKGEKPIEQVRLEAADRGEEPWRLWGPYLAERQWGTVREDYSPGGDAWDYLPHDHARSRAYRWGEDGLAGICDERGRMCLALALWNGRDAFLKERLFGVTNGQGNHGEDVKELYYYLDATPTHSYLKMLYKYPQRVFPYSRLIDEIGQTQPRATRIRTARHGHFRRRPLLRLCSRVRQGRADGHLDARDGAQSRARLYAATHPAATLVSQPLVVAGGRDKKA